MSYRYIEDLATADIAFEATGADLRELFVSAADATMNVMVEDLETIRPVDSLAIHLENREVDMLLFNLLQELIYHKDAERLLLRVKDVSVSEQNGVFALRALSQGEKLDPERHEQRVDVKAVTLHRFAVRKTGEGIWNALVILDV
jgi:SHS2 domain-containing protein